MKIIALVLSLVLTLSVGEVARAQGNTVSFAILPGPFSASLSLEGDQIVLTVDDSTGTSQGWWVTVDCTCPIVVTGDLVTVAGHIDDAAGTPRLMGRTLVAKPIHGMGTYRLSFRATRGQWTLTYGRGQWPSI